MNDNKRLIYGYGAGVAIAALAYIAFRQRQEAKNMSDLAKNEQKKGLEKYGRRGQDGFFYPYPSLDAVPEFTGMTAVGKDEQEYKVYGWPQGPAFNVVIDGKPQLAEKGKIKYLKYV